MSREGLRSSGTQGQVRTHSIGDRYTHGGLLGTLDLQSQPRNGAAPPSISRQESSQAVQTLLSADLDLVCHLVPPSGRCWSLPVTKREVRLLGPQVTVRSGHAGIGSWPLSVPPGTGSNRGKPVDSSLVIPKGHLLCCILSMGTTLCPRCPW